MGTERVRSDYYSLLKRKMLLVVVIICQKKTTFTSDTHLSVNRIQILDPVPPPARSLSLSPCICHLSRPLILYILHLMTLLLIKSDWAFYGCVNPRKTHMFAHKAHVMLSCVLSIWISYATDVALFV